MKRPCLALATLALGLALSPAPSLLPRVWAEGLFSSAPVDGASFAVLARPVGPDDWNLVVLEQLRARPSCWTPRPDGLVDPTLNRFDFTGICGRFIDSNGYSLRVAESDLNPSYRLRLQQQGSQLLLLASNASQTTELLVGRGTVPRRDRDLFVALQLEPGWELRRRVFERRSLNHVYFSNAQPLDTLIATARGRTPESLAPRETFAPPLAPPPLAERRRPERQRPQFREEAPPRSASPAEGGGAGVVQLQVIPYEERISSESRPPAEGGSLSSTDPYAQAQGL